MMSRSYHAIISPRGSVAKCCRNTKPSNPFYFSFQFRTVMNLYECDFDTVMDVTTSTTPTTTTVTTASVITPNGENCCFWS